MKILLLLIPFLLVSCFQEEKIYTLNPDGSGKVQFKATFPLDSVINLNGDGGAEPSPEEKAKDAVSKILKKSEGVAAWADVSYKINDEGKIEFQGTAYFSDLNKVELKMGGIDSDTLKPTLIKKDGLVTVECALVKSKSDAARSEKAKPKWAEMTKNQQKLAMAKARQGLMQMKGMLGGIAGDMSSKVTIHLPAPAKKSTGFKKLTGSSYSITQTGEMMLKGIDKVLADEKIMQSLAGDFDMKQEPPAEVMHQMFGLSADPAVSFPAPAAPAFDYKKELQAAQKATPAMMKKLGLTVIPAAPMVGEAKFKSLRLAGVRIVTPTPDRDVRPFNWSAGTTIALIGELPGAVISTDKGKIETFILNNGQNLLSSKSWGQKLQSVDLSDDGTWLGFEVRSDQLPESGATSIKMLKGEIVCMAASSSKILDLAFAKIAQGEKSEHCGAEITKISESKYNKGKKEISIRFALKKDLIKEVKFFDKDGIQLKSKQNGSSWSGDKGSLTLLCDDALAADCVVKVELFTDLKQHVFPFSIENAPLIPTKSKTK
jgi:hypothetical protein